MQTIFNVLPTRWRQKPAGIDKTGNHVTVTICVGDKVNLCKVFESIMRDSTIRHIEKHNLVNKTSHHGFVKNRSCLTNLLVSWKK